MKAIVIGGSGATGKELIELLLTDPRFTKVLVLGRRVAFPQHHFNPKLEERVVDFDKLDEVQHEFSQGQVAFSCLGTTLKDAGSKQAQWIVDHDYNFNFARYARNQRVESFVLLSAMGVDPQSRFFYSRMKGVLEQNIKQLDFSHTIFVRPGPIDRPHSNRFGEKLAVNTLQFLNRMGLLKNYAPISTTRLAQEMIEAYFKRSAKIEVIQPAVL